MEMVSRELGQHGDQGRFSLDPVRPDAALPYATLCFPVVTPLQAVRDVRRVQAQ